MTASTTDATPQDVVIDLGTSQGIANAEALRERLVEALATEGPLELDASRIHWMDTAAAQVLVAFFKDAHAAERHVVWRGVSEALEHTMKLLGCRAHVGLDSSGGDE